MLRLEPVPEPELPEVLPPELPLLVSVVVVVVVAPPEPEPEPELPEVEPEPELDAPAADGSPVVVVVVVVCPKTAVDVPMSDRKIAIGNFFIASLLH
ncbi:hypothetical protein [Noviherbaspirillum sp.]|uniref:hypothetical protein n=1 Tax=Noviherbaspirillum sp. TaxID=1926288 RepID=UPI002D79B2C9|nr:hypothetical protein [Noviherbaspirillum sp.]